MPDPILYTYAMIAAAIVSALCVLTIGWARRPVAPGTMHGVALVGLGLGLLAGYRVLQLRVSWPPVNGLGRLLTIVLPTVFLIESLLAACRLPPLIRWSLRLPLALAVPRILLHDSIYLRATAGQWTPSQAWALLAVSSASLLAVWALLVCLSSRSSGPSIPVALALTSQSAAVTVMLAGYVTGGAAALPLTAALVATSIAASLLTRHWEAEGVIGIGTVLLFGLLFIGRFFGGLSTGQTLAMFWAPVICWVSELPGVRRRPDWQIVAVRLSAVLAPLAIVLVLAKQSFDRHTAPLL